MLAQFLAILFILNSSVVRARMAHTHYFLRQSEAGVKIFYGFVIYIVCLSRSVNSCSLQPFALSGKAGEAGGDKCTTNVGGAALCNVQCVSYPQCKLAYVTSCSADGQCSCSSCEKLTAVNFSTPGKQFYLHNKQIAENTNSVDFPGGLVPGQPLIFIITLNDLFVSLNFMMANGHVAFMTEIRFNERSVVSNSFFGYWGAENRYTPHFNFYQGQELAVFCLVTDAQYELYLNGVMFKQFPHRVAVKEVTRFLLGRQNSRILTFRR